MNQPLNRILLLSDAGGIDTLTANIPNARIAAICAASIRPQSHAPLQEKAAQLGVPFLIQPKPSDTEAYHAFTKALAQLGVDSILCYSYAMIVRQEMLALVGQRAFNLHGALLPKNRGPNPAQWALIHGDATSGATLHVMDEGVDTGPVIAQDVCPIDVKDTWITLSKRIHSVSQNLFARVAPALLEGHYSVLPQREADARTNPRIPPQSLPINFASMTDRQIYDLIRAQIAPLQGAYLDTPQGRLRFTYPLSLDDIAGLRARLDTGKDTACASAK